MCNKLSAARHGVAAVYVLMVLAKDKTDLSVCIGILDRGLRSMVDILLSVKPDGPPALR